MPPIHR